LARKGAAAANEPVSQHMTAKVITCTRQSTVKDLMERMTNQRIRHVPVVENGRLDGIISIGDLVKHRLSELEVEDQAMHDYSTGRSTPGRRF
jgi:signal-transduction protein with cAMP-binding, CBS, and nucleotidyltransferase domain